MKTTITTILLFICLFGKSQTSDIMYVTGQQTLVVTYNSNYSPIGFYVGGYLMTTFPQPFIYTTPVSIINRLGMSITNHKVSVMGGAFIKNYINNLSLTPDVWVKIYPLRIITNTTKGVDFTLGVNYMDGIRYGVGVSIPIR